MVPQPVAKLSNSLQLILSCMATNLFKEVATSHFFFVIARCTSCSYSLIIRPMHNLIIPQHLHNQAYPSRTGGKTDDVSRTPERTQLNSE